MPKISRRPAAGNRNLPSKYRPEKLSDLRGQVEARTVLGGFAQAATADSSPMAFLFHGPTGTGKTSAAWALAGELGCDLTHPDMGGVIELPSGQQDGQAVRQLLDSLRLRPLMGAGWKVAIINEADNMTPQAEAIWLDGLEKLPPKTVVVFTTNASEKLTGRLLTRTLPIAFTGEPATLRSALRSLARKVWQEETGEELPRMPAHLGVMPGENPTLSFRLALQQLAGYLLAGTIPAETAVCCGVKESTNHGGSQAALKAWETRRRKEANHG